VILKNKIYLYLTEFFAGMSVMAVELGASRLLAPYFSSSQIVWTIIIGTIMIAMALGNIYGGRKADKDPNPDKLYGRIIIAAVWIALIPVLGKYIIVGISALLVFTVSTNFLVIAAFAACMIVFVFPLFLLGTVTPSLVKYTVDSLDDSGKIVGMLNASNTIGSIIGTFVPTFVSIPLVGTSVTFLIFAGILLLLAIIYFISEKKKVLKVPVSVLLFMLCCIFGHNTGFAFWENGLRYEGESIYNYLQVKEDDDDIVLSTNVLFGVQSIYKKDGSLTGMYYDYAMAAPFMTGAGDEKENLKILVLGMGTGTYATQCEKYLGDNFDLDIEGVEIDGAITDLSRKYFSLSDSVKVTTYDGRAFLETAKDKYDVIMVDAYQDITIPFQMSSVEFFTMVKEHLNEDGVMVVNMNMRSDGEGGINEYLADTIASVFPEVYTADVKGYTNRELFASENPEMISLFRENLSHMEDTFSGSEDMELSGDKDYNQGGSDLLFQLKNVNERLVPYEAGKLVLTDDKAPVELLGMRAIDSLIKDEVEYYKEIYKEKGIKGLIEEL